MKKVYLLLFVTTSASLLATPSLYVPGGTLGSTTNTGKVGIGTATPNFNLDVVGAEHVGVGSDNLSNTTNGLSVQDSTGGNVAISVGTSVAHSVGLVWNNSGSTGYAALGTFSNAAPLYLSGSLISLQSKVGIGTSTPNFNLDVIGGTHFGVGGDNMSNTTNGFSVQDSTGSNVAIAVGTSTGHSAGLCWNNSGTTGYASLYTFGNGAPLCLGGSQVILQNEVYVNTNGVGIGTANPTATLSVNGSIRAKEVVVDTAWSDYVFEPGYRLASLSEVAESIKREGHLPGIPSAKEVAAHGVNVAAVEAKLLAKIEELTLHQIELEKQVAALQERLEKSDRSR